MVFFLKPVLAVMSFLYALRQADGQEITAFFCIPANAFFPMNVSFFDLICSFFNLPQPANAFLSIAVTR